MLLLWLSQLILLVTSCANFFNRTRDELEDIRRILLAIKVQLRVEVAKVAAPSEADSSSEKK